MFYYVNDVAQSNGDHEVHKDGCNYMPSNRTYLGNYNNCRDAVNAARKIYSRADGCYWCSKECHTR